MGGENAIETGSLLTQPTGNFEREVVRRRAERASNPAMARAIYTPRREERGRGACGGGGGLERLEWRRGQTVAAAAAAAALPLT